MNPGRFITFEGIDGAGKSTHIGFVTELLKEAGKTVVSSREPGGTPLGEKLRELLLHEKMDLETEALLMFASRREHIAQVTLAVRPHMVAGIAGIVVIAGSQASHHLPVFLSRHAGSILMHMDAVIARRHVP